MKLITRALAFNQLHYRGIRIACYDRGYNTRDDFCKIKYFCHINALERRGI